MNIEVVFLSVARLVLTGLLCCALVSCGPSNSSAPAPIIDDGSDDINSPLTLGTATDVDGVVVLNFSLLEDEPLRGKFHYPEGSDEEDQVIIRSLPKHGILTLQAVGKAFLYTVDQDYFGEDSFRYMTTTGLEVEVQLKVQAVADAPILFSNLPQVVAQGSLFVFLLEASDADADELRYSAVGLPQWLVLDAPTGQLSGTPTQLDIGISETLVFRVTDSTGLFDEISDVQIEVIDVNDAPTLNLSQLPRELYAGETVTARVFPDDADGDAVTLAVEPNRFIQGQADRGEISLTASDVNDVTQVNVVIKATDVQGSVAREIVALTIYPVTETGLGITLSGSEEGRGVHLVILGDGYAVDQQNLFREHVEDAIDNMHSDAGISAHMGAFNIHMISTVSLDSGADDNDTVDARNTAFDSVYNCRSVPRLVCANTLTMLEVALQEYPFVDQIVLLVNDLRYGGSGNSGGSIAITSAYYPEIALHEMGHSLADLADEYVDNTLVETSGLPPFDEGRYRNVTTLTDPEQVPWAHWIDSEITVPGISGSVEVGIYQGGFYRSAGVYRATYNSRMKSFNAPFGPINSEQWVLRLYTLTEGIRGYTPFTDTVTVIEGESTEFHISPLFGAEVQQVEWAVDGKQIKTGEDPNKLDLDLAYGDHSVSVTVSDISDVIRLPAPHAGIFSHDWQVSVQ